MVEKIQSMISEHSILQIDIRYINNEGLWDSITYPTKFLDCNLFAKEINPLENVTLEVSRGLRFFIDPFLAHKTLVILADNLQNVSSNIVKYQLDMHTKANKNIIKTHYECFFTLKDNIKSNDIDSYRDLRAEITMSLLDMEVDVEYHQLVNKHQLINIKNNSENILKHIDDIQKVKYAILMVAKAYNVKIDAQFGVFTTYKNPYVLLNN